MDNNEHIELNEAQLKYLKRIEIDILVEIDRICRENNIKYTLAYGTLLGAVRHKGFIPWDDDIDIAMLRSDYEKFIELAPKYLSNKFYLTELRNNCFYALGYAKVMAKDTCMKELELKYSKAPDGIFVDIFPLDFTSSDKKRSIKQYNTSNRLHSILYMEGNYYFPGSSFKYNFGRKYIARFIPRRLFVRLYFKNTTMYNNGQDKKQLTSLFSGDGITKGDLPYDIFKDYIQLEFEGRKFSAIKNYDYWLSAYYGDYMKLPPENERVPHHFVCELDVSGYDFD